jgi:hypothetical protein
MGEGAQAGDRPASVTDSERVELGVVLSSQTFARAQRLVKLLGYISEKHFQGQANEVCEYSIATEVLARPANFDSAEDAIARVEIHRLRKKLRDYYATEGAHRPLKIVIPSGMYTPVFLHEGNGSAPVNGKEPAPINGNGKEPGAPHTAEAAPVPVLEPPAQDPALPPSLPAASGTWKKWLLAAAAVALVAVMAAALRTGAASPAVIASSHSGPPLAIPSADNAVRIIAGYDRQYIDHHGHTWQPDYFYEGGGRSAAPFRQFIARTSDPVLYQNGRIGAAGYNIPLKPGNYELKLHFVEPVYGPGLETGGGENSRVFDILVNGKTLVDSFDIVSDAGGPQIADVRVFKDIQAGPDGLLRVSFHAKREQPLINALEIEPAPPHKINPIRLVTQPNSVTDSQGQVWSADNYYMGGMVSNHFRTVEGTPDADLFGHERYGHFSYAIPVAAASYTVNLYFAETYFGLQNEGLEGLGQRVFDVYCNGLALLRNFDMFKEAGANRALIKRFRGLRPNGQGKLVLEFVPVVNYGSVFAIEVLDEGR